MSTDEALPGSPELLARNADRVLERVSPSQVEAFEMCPRRWYNQSVLGWREAESPAMARGTSIGKDAEDYYVSRGAQRPSGPHKELVEVILPLLGEPSEHVTVEEWVELDTFPGGPKLRGRYDFYDAEAKPRFTEGPYAAAPMPKLSDIKSRSKKIYFKTDDPQAPEDKRLDSDLQLNLYVRAKLVETGLHAIAVGHCYTLTSGKPKGLEVLVPATLESTTPRFLKSIESVKAMSRWARERPATADPLPPNTAVCDKFPPNGCPHRSRCGFEHPGLAGALKYARPQGETKMADGPTLMERLELAKKGLLGATPSPAPAPPAPVIASTPAPVAAAPAGGFCSKCGQGLTHENVSRLSDGNIVHVGCRNALPVESPAVVPPDAPARTSTAEEIAAASAPKEKKTRAKKEVPAAAPESTGRDPKLDLEAIEANRRAQPGNIRKDGKLMTVGEIEDLLREPVPGVLELPGVIDSVTNSVSFSDPVSAAPIGQTEKTGAWVSDELPVGPVIYIDCFPVKGPHRASIVHFEEWMAPICEEVARKKGVVDWRLIQYTAKGDLAAEVRGVISTLPPVIHVSKFAPSADVFLECVVPWASQIIRGI